MPWWAISASIVATETSTITLISVPGIAYARGGDFRFLQLVFGYLLGRVVISLLFIPRYFEGRLATVYELLQGRFGGKVRALAASLFITARTVGDGVRLLLTALVLAAVYRSLQGTADDEWLVLLSIVVVGVVMILFTWAGGIEAVVWIEVVQLAIYLAGAIASALVLIDLVPGGVAGAIAAGSAEDKFRMFDFSVDPRRTYSFWAGLIGGCFLTMSTHGTDQFMVQRYLCTDKPRKAALALLVSGAAVLTQFIGFLFIGVLLFAFYRPDRLPGYASGPPAAPFSSGDQVFADFITHHLPTGISGLVVAAIFAAAMSSSLSAIASTAVADLYAPLSRNRSDRHFLNVSRGIVLAAGVAQIAFAIILRGSDRSALDTALGVASLINGPILGVFLLAAVRRGGPAAALIGMLAGLAAVLPLRFATAVAWPWYAVVGSLTTLGVGVVADAMTKGRER
jgi:solute:Na+ symporter, SSS family